MNAEEKKHLSVVVVGHVDCGKSTTAARLLFELGALTPAQIQQFREETSTFRRYDFRCLFFRNPEEISRDLTINVKMKNFYTEHYHYTILDVPGHRKFMKNMLSGASQADVALIMVPADGNFSTAIAKGNPQAGEVQGQTRQHALLMNLLGIKQIIIGINKMDSDQAGYKEARYLEIKEEMIKYVLTKVGFKQEFVERQVPFLPISGWIGDNIVTRSSNMPWWKGAEIEVPGKGKRTIFTLLQALDEIVLPVRENNKSMRTPISAVLMVKGIGDVVIGRVEQGVVNRNDEVLFLPTHTSHLPCAGKVLSIEMHNKSQPQANTGDIAGFRIYGLYKHHMPRSGNIMILKKDYSLKRVKEFICKVQIINHPGELKVGYSPIAFVRTAHSAVRLSKIVWKITSKVNGNIKISDPTFIKANEMAEVIFQPLQPFMVDTFNNCEGLGRIAILEGATVVMLGKVIEVLSDDDGDQKF